jgi:serine/threonine-protein kinase RsbW
MSAHVQPAGLVENPTVRLTIPAKAEYITLVRLALSGISRLRPLSEEVLGDLKLAVTEACTNSVRHGYENGEGTVEVLYELQPDRFVVEVSDDGPGFDPSGDRPTEENLAEGGLGIAIIRAVSDEFEAGERAAGHGSKLRFVKLLDT